jgi:hypothetical protein
LDGFSSKGNTFAAKTPKRQEEKEDSWRFGVLAAHLNERFHLTGAVSDALLFLNMQHFSLQSLRLALSLTGLRLDRA